MSSTYRVAVIGHTGRGNYGHHIDMVWTKVPDVAVVGVSDPDPSGLAAAVKRLKAAEGFADYRQMLARTRPDLVAVCPRFIDQHHAMILAAIEHGARGLLVEKPFCATLEEADAIVAACEKHNVKLVISHQTRYSPRLHVVWDLIQQGAIGKVLEFRGRGKEDSRGGGEDLWVLGSHVLNLVHYLGGAPQWCFGSVLAEGRPVTAADVRPGGEGIGPLAGDEVHAMYRLAGGAMASFDSVRNAKGNPSRFGLQIIGSQGIIEMGIGYLPPVNLLADSSWSPGRTGKTWTPVSSAGVGKPEPLSDGGLLEGNVLAVQDLLGAIRQNRQPEASVYEAQTSIEMIAAVFESHRLGRPVAFPLKTRKNPLALLGQPT